MYKELPTLLRALEDEGVSELRRRGRRSRSEEQQRLGIHHAIQSGTDFPGSIYITIQLTHERSGGFVPDDTNAVAAWISVFLESSACADVRSKLVASKAIERHAFVLVPGFSTAPFEVTDALMRQHAPIPADAPTLPREVTHIWVASTWSSGLGFHWSPTHGWSSFEKDAGTQAA